MTEQTSYVWPLSWGPSYKVSFAISACMSALAIVMCFFFRTHLSFLNKLAEDDDQEFGISSRLSGEARGVSKSFRYML